MGEPRQPSGCAARCGRVQRTARTTAAAVVRRQVHCCRQTVEVALPAAMCFAVPSTAKLAVPQASRFIHDCAVGSAVGRIMRSMPPAQQEGLSSLSAARIQPLRLCEPKGGCVWMTTSPVNVLCMLRHSSSRRTCTLIFLS